MVLTTYEHNTFNKFSVSVSMLWDNTYQVSASSSTDRHLLKYFIYINVLKSKLCYTSGIVWKKLLQHEFTYIFTYKQCTKDN